MIKLPDRFASVESLLQRMPLNLADGSKGLLAHGKLGDAVHSELEACEINDIVDERLLSGKWEIIIIIIFSCQLCNTTFLTIIINSLVPGLHFSRLRLPFGAM